MLLHMSRNQYNDCRRKIQGKNWHHIANYVLECLKTLFTLLVFTLVQKIQTKRQ